MLLVTSPAHMPRSEALFRRHGLDVVPAVSESLPDSARSWTRALVPNRYALRASETAIYEFGVYALYWLKGDIAE